MSNIYFYSPKGYAPLKAIRHLLSGSHGYATGDVSQPEFGVYGVAIPRSDTEVMEVVDALAAAGVFVLPSVHDTQTPLQAEVASALATYGVLPSDTAFETARKMHAASGMPVLRPHRY